MPATKLRPVGRVTRAAITPTPRPLDEISNAIMRREPVRHCVADDRLNLLIEGKDRLWKRNLRISELVNVVIISAASAFVMSQCWAWWAVAVASISAVACMWAFAHCMTPREQRLSLVQISHLAVNQTQVVQRIPRALFVSQLSEHGEVLFIQRSGGGIIALA